MVALTFTQHATLLDNGLPENKFTDHIPVVKLFLPGTRFIWMITFIDHENNDLAFGLCDTGMGIPELGYGSIKQLGLMNSFHGDYVQQDTYFNPKFPLSVYTKAAYALGYITESESLLAKYAPRKPPGMRPI